jgi:hypothetical protein
MAGPFKMKGMEFKSPVKHNLTSKRTFGTGENKYTSYVQVAHDHDKKDGKGKFSHDKFGNPRYHKKGTSSRSDVKI